MTKRKRKNGKGSKWIRVAKRLTIYHRDGFACVVCRRGAEHTTLTLDHVRARENGGANDACNLVTMCHACNSAKQDKTRRVWFAVLRALGFNTKALAKRIARRVARPLDMGEGQRLAAARRGEP